MRRTFLLAVLVGVLLPATAGATTFNATPATFATVLGQAQDGDTILLASGSYGTWDGTSKAVLIKADAGATPTMQVNFNTGDANFTLDGLGGLGGDIDNGANHITIKNSAFISPTVFQGLDNSSILFDNDKFNNINAVSGGPPGRIWLPGDTPHHTGLTIQNSQFIGGSTDGVQAGTALNLLNNEFANIVHGSCADCHTDSVQLFGGQAADGVGSTIHGNYFHDSEDGIVQFDGGGGHDIRDNVIVRMSLFGADFGGDRNTVFVHNTLALNPNKGLDMTSKAGQNSVGTVIRDNILDSLDLTDSDSNAQPAANDHNMIASGATGQNFAGTPQFVGGANPNTYAGFALASGSPGKGAASDGLDVGVRFGGSPPPPQCSDGVDNDNDGFVDFPSDPGCTSAGDNDETDPLADHFPTARFTATPEPSASGQVVHFDGTASTCEDGPCVYAWVDDGADGPGGTDWPLGTGPQLDFTFQNAGTKFVRLTVTDADGDSDTVEHDHVVTAADTTPPDTTITSGPPSSTTSTSATFAFTSTEAGSTFECKLDAGTYVACTSPNTYNSLAVGSHTFSVRATDAVGNTDATPASASWTITAPSGAPPAVVGEGETSWGSQSGSTKTVTVNTQAGDVLVAYGGTENSAYTETISGGGTWTNRCPSGACPNVGGGNLVAPAYVWSAPVTTAGSKTVTFTRAGGSGGAFGGDVLVFRGSSGVGASGKATGTGAPSVSVTTTKDRSAIVVFNNDWNAVNGVSRVWRADYPLTETTYALVPNLYTVYGGYLSDVGVTGSKTVGLSAPSGQKYAVVALEVKGS